MALFPLPAAAEVRAESDLQPAMASPTFTTNAQLDADIAGRITAAAAVVDAEVLSVVSVYSTPDLDPQLLSLYEALSTEEIKLRAVASLYFSAGALNDKYDAKAKDYERRADAINALRTRRMQGSSTTDNAATENVMGTISLAPYAGLIG